MLARTPRLHERIAALLEARLDAEREQLPLWLPVAMVSGVAAWFLLPDPFGWGGFIGVAAAGVLAGLAFGRGGRAGAALAWFGLLAAIGCALVWLRAESVAAPRLTRPQAAEFTARLVRIDRIAARDQRRLLLEPEAAPNLPPRLRVSVPLDETLPPDLTPGGRVRLRAFLLPPPPMAVPGAYDFSQSAWFAGIGATGRALGPVTVVAPAEEGGWAAWLASARAGMSAHIQEVLPGGSGAIAAALATGDQNGIFQEDADAMRRSGLAHLLSVSGLHISAMAGAVFVLLLRLLALRPWLALRINLLLVAAGGAALAAIAYTIFTGAEVPTIRSCVAVLLVLAGLAMGREAVTLRLVAAGAMIVLLAWPESAAGPSFQLSFAAITAIVALHEHPRMKARLERREECWWWRLMRNLVGLLLTGLVVEVALAPVALFHFHQTGLYGALANIVAIPLTTFVIMPAEALALLFDTAGIGAPFWSVAGVALDLLLGLAHAVADAPGSLALLPAFPAFAYGLIVAGLLWIGLWRTGWRWWGGVPLALGLAVAMLTPAPDLLITGDGRHLAVRAADGQMVLLRGRAGDYVRDLLSEVSGVEADFLDMETAPMAACSDALCAYDLKAGGRTWHILATRTRDIVDIAAMNQACAAADIVISDRRLPRSCRPTWLKADLRTLSRTGGLAIRLRASGATVTSVRDLVGNHPWATAGEMPRVPGRGLPGRRPVSSEQPPRAD